MDVAEEQKKRDERKRNYNGPIPATDIIIEYSNGQKSGIILITRKNYPYGMAIPGGFAEKGLTLEENAAKEAKEETGLEIRIRNPWHPYVFSDPARDPRFHMISHVYIARGYGNLGAGDDAKTADLYTIDEVKSFFGRNLFAFDHEKILKQYVDRWRQK